jgi:hypothetical protein
MTVGGGDPPPQKKIRGVKYHCYFRQYILKKIFGEARPPPPPPAPLAVTMYDFPSFSNRDLLHPGQVPHMTRVFDGAFTAAAVI